MASEWLDTIPEVIKAVKTAHTVWVVPRFGCSETHVKISKKEALYFLTNNIGINAKPDEWEMGTGSFARLDECGDLYIG